MDKFHLFPPEASSTAQQVDWIYFALTALTYRAAANAGGPAAL